MYQAPLKDYDYLRRCFGTTNSTDDQSMFDAILKSIDDLCQNQMLATNYIGDEQGIQFDPAKHTVTLPESYPELADHMRELGLFSLEHPSQWGGLNLPKTICQLSYEMLMSANSALFLGMSLTHSACMAIEKNGSDMLKETYLPNMVSGDWMGTMCLTESHCGTDLGMIKTKAIPEQKHYLISGQKIWITFGEHDLAENIIHLVLAKLPDAPDGSHGISLFLVPKWLPDGTRNQVHCSGIEHKMGTHVSPTCVMQFEQAKGFIIGKPNEGLANMFVMMNDARKTVANQGIALAEAAYQYALTFVKDRRQSRSLDPKKNDLSAAADPILSHPDVRRQLMHAKALIIGMRASLYFTHTLPKDSPLVDLLTPVLKSFCTETGCEAIDHCLQVMGGSGYVKDWHVEQCYRDARIAMIYEGTNGIQALDFVMRKIKQYPLEWQAFINDTLKDASRMTPDYRSAIQMAMDEVSMHAGIIQRDLETNKEVAAAKAPIYLKLVGYALVTYVWGKLMQSEPPHGYQALSVYVVEHITPNILKLSSQLSKDYSLITEIDQRLF